MNRSIQVEVTRTTGDDLGQGAAVEVVTRVVVHHSVVPVIRGLDQLIRLVVQPRRHDKLAVALLAKGRLGPVAVCRRRHVWAAGSHHILLGLVLVLLSILIPRLVVHG